MYNKLINNFETMEFKLVLVYTGRFEENDPMIQWKITARKVSKAHLGHELKDSKIKNFACYWPLSSCPPLV